MTTVLEKKTEGINAYYFKNSNEGGGGGGGGGKKKKRRENNNNNKKVTHKQSERLVECCFTSTETVGLLGTGAQTATSTLTQLLSSGGGKTGRNFMGV